MSTRQLGQLTRVALIVSLVTAAGFACPQADASSSVAAPYDFNGDGHRDLAVGAPGEYVAGTAGAGQVHIVFGSAKGVTRQDQLINQAWPGHPPVAAERFGSVLTSADFDRDGFSDLAVGIPDHADSGGSDVGEVVIFTGSRTGLTDDSASDQLYFPSQANQRFGAALAVADFDGNGFPDLAVGSPGATVTGQQDAGEVDIFFGSQHGLQLHATPQTWTQDSVGMPDEAEADDRFGEALAVGDLNGDHHPDLIVGVPGETVATNDPLTMVKGGAVEVLYGSSSGLSTNGSQLWSENSPGLKGTSSEQGSEEGKTFGDDFGAALSVGDFNDDHYGDVAIGAPDKRIAGGGSGTPVFDGSVNVLYGSGQGLDSADNQYFSEATAGVPGRGTNNGQFGESLAAGDFNHDGASDLAVGAPGDPVHGHATAGTVTLFLGQQAGLSVHEARRLTQDTSGVAGHAERGDMFGLTMRAANFGAGPSSDLVVGAPGEDEHGATNAGAIDLFYGTSRGALNGSRSQKLTEDSRGMRDQCEPGDSFGYLSTSLRHGAGNGDIQ